MNSPNQLKMGKILLQHEVTTGSKIRIFVETGTYKGGNVAVLAPLFAEAHSIELSPHLYREAVKTFGPASVFGINFHLGDSAVVLPEVLANFQEPVAIYLDAHYWAVPFVAAGHFPLWKELEAISQRPFADLILVDDVNTFGKKRPDLEARETGPSWEHVSEAAILKALKKHVFESYVDGDQFIVHLAAA